MPIENKGDDERDERGDERAEDEDQDEERRRQAEVELALLQVLVEDRVQVAVGAALARHVGVEVASVGAATMSWRTPAPASQSPRSPTVTSVALRSSETSVSSPDA